MKNRPRNVRWHVEHARLILVLTILVLSTVNLHAEGPDVSKQCAPAQSVQELWRSATSGSTLNPQDWRNVQKGHFSQESAWPSDGAIRIFSNEWTIVSCKSDGHKAEVVVTTAEAGLLNDSLKFIPSQQGLFTVQKRYNLVLAPTHWYTRKPDLTIDREMTGPARWQVEGAETPWTTINSAIKYILAKSLTSRDPVFKQNAGEALEKLAGIKEPTSSANNRKSPVELIEHLCMKATDGDLLGPDGQKESSQLFSKPNTRSGLHTIQIVDNDWAISQVNVEGEKAKISVGYGDAGQIDSILRYIPPKPSPFFKTEFQYSLSTTSRDGNWIIDGSPDMFLGNTWATVNAAIRYIVEAKKKTKDPVIRKNADKALAALLKYK